MNAAQFLNIIKKRNALEKEDFRSLLKLHETFPYFLVPKVLAAKYEKKISKGESQELLHWAAVQSPDRAWLKTLIEGDIHFAPPVSPEPAKATPAPQPSKDTTPEKAAPTAEDAPDKAASQQPSGSDRTEILRKLEENLNKLRHAEADKKTESDKETPSSGAKAPKKKAVKKKDPKNDDLIETIRKKEKKVIKDAKKQEQLDIIKAFSKKEIKLATIKEIEDTGQNTDLSKNSTQLSDKLLSESYAKLLTKQGKKAKAIDIYQKLSLKFPNKKAYFANLIKELKD
ncbi:hypothetical protein [Echinicola vietnamensis]|uniref:Tetratricopeptide repeat protein n=1 Tax=Echinicola vietnamensis (strain DSM 17526 / LMG 23754 / KMM 6221) TaxID=926556 RepID=L0G0U9_ECHVK|nr:hypothetical protein [Echinicola vietnamensis]AGA78621.1 hypothetical protein Echvi_2373 [Echinicola vietnamensis DSM 17526]